MAASPKRETTRSVVPAKATTAIANAAAANVLVVFISLDGIIIADVLERFSKTAVGQYAARLERYAH